MSYIKVTEDNKKVIIDVEDLPQTFYDTADADAKPEDVDEGKIFYNAEGRQVGTKPVNNVM